MNFPEIYSASGMIELIQKIGFLPLLDSGIEGFSAEDIVAEDCGYVRLPEGGWDWPLWKWKGAIVQEMPCMYGIPNCLRSTSASAARIRRNACAVSTTKSTPCSALLQSR